MICNAKDLSKSQKERVAERVSALSQEPNSSLLEKSREDVLSIIDSGIVITCVENNKPLFIVAFEPTGDDRYTEVGMTCNIDPELIRGKHIFPLIVDFYRRVNGNGKKVLYLTTTDIRMIRVTEKSGFKKVNNLHKLFPPEVLRFCCSPCLPEKTGIKIHGQQIEYCPRFNGCFLPKSGAFRTRIPCTVFAQII